MINKIFISYYAFQAFSYVFAMNKDDMPFTLSKSNVLTERKTLDDFDFKITTYYNENNKNYDLAVDIKEKTPLPVKLTASSQISNLGFSNANADTKISKKRKTSQSQVHTYEGLKVNNNQIMNKVEVRNVKLLARNWNHFFYDEKNGKFFIIKQNWIRKITASKKK